MDEGGLGTPCTIFVTFSVNLKLFTIKLDKSLDFYFIFILRRGTFVMISLLCVIFVAKMAIFLHFI